MTDTITLADRIAAALRANEAAKIARPEDNPFVDHDLKQMRVAGIRSAQDKHPAVNMATKKTPLGYDLEVSRTEELAQARLDKSARRMAQARTRAARKAEFDAIVESEAPVNAERMQQAWVAVVHLLPVIDRIAASKRRWAARHLGDVKDDVAAVVREKVAMLLAKSDRDLDVLVQAAKEIGEIEALHGAVPGDQVVDERAPEERKRVMKARKWLMGVLNNRVLSALTDLYLSEQNLRWDNLDLIETVMASINGPSEDPTFANFKASSAPAFMGTSFQRPGGIDPALLATAVNAAITEKGLDRLTELLLAERNTNGSFPWSEHAEAVFKTVEQGDWLWEQVVRATTGRNRDGIEWTMDRARKARGDYARTFVRAQFEWMPSLIVSVVEAFDPHPIGWDIKAGEARVTMASDFELFYLPDEPEKRQVLSPVLRYASIREAAEALVGAMEVVA